MRLPRLFLVGLLASSMLWVATSHVSLAAKSDATDFLIFQLNAIQLSEDYEEEKESFHLSLDAYCHQPIYIEDGPYAHRGGRALLLHRGVIADFATGSRTTPPRFIVPANKNGGSCSTLSLFILDRDGEILSVLEVDVQDVLPKAQPIQAIQATAGEYFGQEDGLLEVDYSVFPAKARDMGEKLTADLRIPITLLNNQSDDYEYAYVFNPQSLLFPTETQNISGLRRLCLNLNICAQPLPHNAYGQDGQGFDISGRIFLFKHTYMQLPPEWFISFEYSNDHTWALSAEVLEKKAVWVPVVDKRAFWMWPDWLGGKRSVGKARIQSEGSRTGPLLLGKDLWLTGQDLEYAPVDPPVYLPHQQRAYKSESADDRAEHRMYVENGISNAFGLRFRVLLLQIKTLVVPTSQ